MTQSPNHPITQSPNPIVLVYGADWCEDTRRSLRQLRRLAVRHQYFNIDEDLDALDRAMALSAGQRRTPTIDLDGQVLVEPTNGVLAAALIARGDLTDEELAERISVQNVGDLERAVRGGMGLFLLLMASRAPRISRLPLRLVGVGTALTGLTGWCPGYAAAQVTSLEGPGDRPAESNRRSWVAHSVELSR
jgi:glutaredoxin